MSAVGGFLCSMCLIKGAMIDVIAAVCVMSYRSLLQPLQQLLLDGVVKLSGDQSFLLQTQQVC